MINGITYKLRLLPSGIVRKNKISIIGNGVVIDPWALLEEIDEIKSKGVQVDVDNFIISEFDLILPFQKKWRNGRRFARKENYVRRGIGQHMKTK